MEVGQEKVLEMEGREKMVVGAWVWGKFWTKEKSVCEDW